MVVGLGEGRRGRRDEGAADGGGEPLVVVGELLNSSSLSAGAQSSETDGDDDEVADEDVAVVGGEAEGEDLQAECVDDDDGQALQPVELAGVADAHVVVVQAGFAEPDVGADDGGAPRTSRVRSIRRLRLSRGAGRWAARGRRRRARGRADEGDEAAGVEVGEAAEFGRDDRVPGGADGGEGQQEHGAVRPGQLSQLRP